MLDCGTNYKTGYHGRNCSLCKVEDDENHRINDCPKYQDKNLSNSSYSVNFDCIYSEDNETVDRVLYVICEIWDLRNGKNTMQH